MAALSVEHLKVLLVEHLKVRVYLLGGGLMVEPACASLTVEHAYASSSIYLFAPQISQKMVEHLKVLISRAPKGDGGQSSLLTHSIYLLGGGAYGRAPKGPYGRAPKGDGGQSSLLAHP